MTEECADLAREWMNFIFGIVDMEDLTRTISGETLQNKLQRFVKATLVKMRLEMFDEIGLREFVRTV